MIDAAWAAIIVTIVLALIAAFVGLWKHSENVWDHANTLAQTLHDRVSRVKSEIEQRFHNIDNAYRSERHKMLDDIVGMNARLVNDLHHLELRIAKLEHHNGEGDG